MRFTSSFILSVSLLLSSQVQAFPSFNSNELSSNNIIPFSKRDSIPDPLAGKRSPARDFSLIRRKRALKSVPDADHPYKAPRSGDQRSPCPGLNTLAGHGYIPRNGIVHASDIIEGAQKGFNMGFDFATFLALLAVYTDGDVLTQMVNIGGSTASGKGLNYHGKIEGDASLSREDYHFNGQNSKLSQERYAAFKSFNDKYSGGNATKESLIEYRYQRFLDSRNHNPSFTFLPPRYIFSYGEAALVLNLFSNSKDGTSGVSTSSDDLDSFFLEEKFPQNWFPRETPYTLVNLMADTPSFMLPRFVPPGQNIGGAYVPLQASFTQDDLTPNKLGCALYESAIAGGLTPSSLGNLGLANNLLSAVTNLAGQIYKPFQKTFDCAPANVKDPSATKA